MSGQDAPERVAPGL